MLVQAGLCQTCSETTLLVFPRGGSFQRFSPKQQGYSNLNFERRFLGYEENLIAKLVSQGLKRSHLYLHKTCTLSIEAARNQWAAAMCVVRCGSPKKSPHTSSIVQIIFFFWSFEVSKIEQSCN